MEIFRIVCVLIFSRPNQSKDVDFSNSNCHVKQKKKKKKIKKKSMIPSAADSSLPV